MSKFTNHKNYNLIKITFPTCFPLLIGHGMGDMTLRNHITDEPMSKMFNDMINMGCDLFQPIRLLIAKKAF